MFTFEPKLSVRQRLNIIIVLIKLDRFYYLLRSSDLWCQLRVMCVGVAQSRSIASTAPAWSICFVLQAVADAGIQQVFISLQFKLLKLLDGEENQN